MKKKNVILRRVTDGHHNLLAILRKRKNQSLHKPTDENNFYTADENTFTQIPIPDITRNFQIQVFKQKSGCSFSVTATDLC